MLLAGGGGRRARPAALEARPLAGRRAVDLTGQRFGSLTVLRQAGRLNGGIAWRCRCSCGGERVVRADRLISREVYHCGCRRGNRGSAGRAVIDLTGQRFGRLVVVSPAPRICGRTAWFCRCDCGGTCHRRGNDLVQHQSISCGCLARERARKNGAQLSAWVRELKASAARALEALRVT